MLKIAAGLLVVFALALIGFSLIDGASGDEVAASAEFLAPDADVSRFARADAPRAWDFPRDFGAHEAFQTEWWYYTGNVADSSGRRFGYQFTIFRRAITPPAVGSLPTGGVENVAPIASQSPPRQALERGPGGEVPPSSEFRTSQVYMVHFTLSDIDAGAFYHEQRFSRGGAGLAFALPDESQPDAAYQVALENWAVKAGDAPDTYTLSAESASGFAVDFTLTDEAGVALQGDNGLSAKSGVPGNASYYYSQPRLLTEGEITVGGEKFTVSGASWMDHEFSTSALGSDAVGWDWFGVQFDDGRELMVGQIRLADGGREPAFGGLLIDAGGAARYLPSDQFTITPTGSWVSPHTGATYPAGWDITVLGEGGLTFQVTPLQADQELHDSAPAYWEGAVRLSGDVTGYGYAELTGYADPMTQRF